MLNIGTNATTGLWFLTKRLNFAIPHETFSINKKDMILLSFDTEEFDVPREHGVDIQLEESMRVSVAGTNRILDVLKANGVRATFFCTGNFAQNAP